MIYDHVPLNHVQNICSCRESAHINAMLSRSYTLGHNLLTLHVDQRKLRVIKYRWKLEIQE